MSDVALHVENLGKRYQLGQSQQGTDGLRHIIERKLSAPFRRFRRKEAELEQTSKSKQSAEKDFWALKDVSFDVKQGEVVGVIGRNGAGKSTLLKILSRITEPTKGRICITGRVASLLEVGTGFHQELTGRENIYLNGAILGMTKAEITRKFDEITAFAEVERFLDTPVKRYSSGMYVRLAFAVAAHLESEILIIDEVLAVGDAQFQDKCLGKMKQVASSGRTVLFVSHNVNAVERLCTTALMLEGGQVAERSSDVRSVIHRYLRNNGDEATASLWRNSGSELENPWFKPLRFAVVEEDGSAVIQSKSNDASIYIEIEAEVQELDPALTVGYCIYDENGDLLYWSYHTDSAPEFWPTLHVGKCTIRSPFPKRLFNEGSYRLELIGGLTFRQWLFSPGNNAPTISITLQGGLSDSPLWMQRRPGILAPVMSWQLHESS